MKNICLCLIIVQFLQVYQVHMDRTCILLNGEFRDYYLYASPKSQLIKTSSRSVALRNNIFSNQHLKDFTSEEKQGIWILKHVNDTLSTYYIKNLALEEYLFSNEKGRLQKLLGRERSIKTDKIKHLESLDERYMWNFKKATNGLHEIWNVKFNEPLYPVGFIFSQDLIRKTVVTVKDKKYSDKILWDVKCLG